MATTQVPAFKAQVGDWTYYIGIMTYAEVAGQIKFAYQLTEQNEDLSNLLQRGVAGRTDAIRDYLLTNEHRFLGALVVGVWGGDPEFHDLEMAERSVLMPDLDKPFGVLVFNGSQSYFALDGQHRLRAIQEAVERDPAIGSDQIAVLMVSHMDTPEGKERTRRLFANINRTAKVTTKQENIALDEDDAFAIVTRKLIGEHDTLSRTGVVRVFTTPPGAGDAGEIKLATAAIPRTDTRAWTNIGTLYEMLLALGWGLDPAMTEVTTGARRRPAVRRPADEVVDRAYAILAGRLDGLLDACGDLRRKLVETADARTLRDPSEAGRGHPFMRPVVQRYLAETLDWLVDDQKRLSWDSALERLGSLDWELGSPPWLAVYSAELNRMLTGRDNIQLLKNLLEVHLSPASAGQIEDARGEYRGLFGSDYPVSADALAARLAAGGDAA